jgi:membrane protease YdiL (CAAX protease family)
MKRCPYCGKEYPDEAICCSIDGQSLPDNHPQSQPSAEQTVDAPSGKNTPYLTFPDYKWSARDAWKCFGMILVFGFVLSLVNRLLDLNFPNFMGSGFGYFLSTALRYSVYLLVAAYFARTEKMDSFWKGFGLDQKPSNYVWFGVAAALIIRAFSHFMLIHGWGKGVSNYDITAFRDTIGIERYGFLFPALLLAPVFEESINRGFLYKAFRGSYSLGVSMTLLVAWAALNHSRFFYSHSMLAVFDMSLLTIVQCYLREKSNSLWDCILCHFAFNASLLFVTDALR